VLFAKNKTYLTYLIAILLVLSLLLSLGLIMIYSTSSLKGIELFGDPYIFVKKQGIAVVLGFAVFAFIQCLPLRWIEIANIPLLFLSLFMLALILIDGIYVKVGGAERWLSLFGYRIQPSEIIKISFLFFLSRFVSLKHFNPQDFKKSLLPILAIFLVIAGLLALQKDFGSILILGLLTTIMLFLANLPLRYLVLTGFMGTAVLGALILLEPYRIQRMLSFLDPWSQFEHGGFQIVQSFLAFQNGGFWGAGLGSSKQKLFFLPEAHTDFILSVLGEELGLFGVLLIITAFLFITFLGFSISQQQITPARKFLGFGLISLFAIQATLNMGVTMGLLPTKGLPLPFLSSGMSSLLTFMIVLALLARLAREIPEPRHG
jgi:cell division protein FtsW